jgi:hypothetical protein
MRSKSMTVIAALIAVFAISAVGAGTAFASGSPSVETKPATNIAESSATLNGAVNPNGTETKYYFEYGTTTKYGKKTAEASAGSGTASLEESKAITGLVIDTAYDLRIVATNSNKETSYGGNEEFVTTLKVGPEFIPGEGAKFPITFEDAAKKSASSFASEGSSLTPHCEGAQVKGAITVAKFASVTLEFTNCALSGNSKVWNTGERAEGRVALPGKGTLVYIDKAEKKVAILDTLPKIEIHGEAGFEAWIEGTLVIPITPLNTSTTKFALPIHGEGCGVGGCKQEYRSYENEKGEVVKNVLLKYSAGDGFSEASLQMEGTNEVTAGNALSVKG